MIPNGVAAPPSPNKFAATFIATARLLSSFCNLNSRPTMGFKSFEIIRVIPLSSQSRITPSQKA